MSEPTVMDASAVLSYLWREQGWERVDAVLETPPCLMSAVNVCEVLSKLCERGMTIEQAQTALAKLRLTIVDFDSQLAVTAASLRLQTKSIGASLGDRACLALARTVMQGHGSARVLTTDRAWSKLEWPFRIVNVRDSR